MGTDTREMPVHVQQGGTTNGSGADDAPPWVTSAAGRTHRGSRRSENQDRMYVGEAVFAVADGIGGRRGGATAAELAIAPMDALDQAAVDRGDLATRLHAAVEDANARVRERRRTTPALERMGTTLTAMALQGTEVHVAHVGDSRLYRLRGTTFEQLTTDHTLVQRLVDQGQLTPEGAEDHPHDNVITRAVGTRPEVDVDTAVVDLALGDAFLICSDGLPSALDEPVLAAALGSPDPVSEVVAHLVDESIRAGAADNVTAVVVRVGAPR